MKVSSSGSNAAMTEHHLNEAQVGSVFKMVSRETMPKDAGCYANKASFARSKRYRVSGDFGVRCVAAR